MIPFLHFPNEDRWRKLGLFTFEKKSLCGGLIATFQCLKGLFIRNWSEGMRSNGFKVKEGKFRLDIWKNFFPVRVVEQ